MASTRGTSKGSAALPVVVPSVGHAQSLPPLIAGAADLQFALSEVTARFRAETGQEVRLSRGSSGERENPVERIVGMLALADEAQVTLGVGDPGGHPLGFALPLHAARRNGVAVGEPCSVSLLKHAIPAMPCAPAPWPRDHSPRSDEAGPSEPWAG